MKKCLHNKRPRKLRKRELGIATNPLGHSSHHVQDLSAGLDRFLASSPAMALTALSRPKPKRLRNQVATQPARRSTGRKQ